MRGPSRRGSADRLMKINARSHSARRARAEGRGAGHADSTGRRLWQLPAAQISGRRALPAGRHGARRPKARTVAPLEERVERTDGRQIEWQQPENWEQSSRSRRSAGRRWFAGPRRALRAGPRRWRLNFKEEKLRESRGSPAGGEDGRRRRTRSKTRSGGSGESERKKKGRRSARHTNGEKTTGRESRRASQKAGGARGGRGTLAFWNAGGFLCYL